MKEIFPSLWVFQNEFDTPEHVYNSVESIIESNPRFNWDWAQTSASVELNSENHAQNRYRSNKVFPISANSWDEKVHELDLHVFNKLTKFIGEYAEHFQLGNIDDEGYVLLKYETGTMYNQHYDCGPKQCHRVFSVICYLNDDYEGGELEFPYLNLTYKPSAGDVLVFPSNYTFSHIAHPVKSGVKYSLVTWAEFAKQHNG
jgi:Rps23 Pro-64 3,4-dihydroxylase Tpa1-like proline 4-hydroxylase